MDEVSAVGYLIHGFNGLSDLLDEPLAPMVCRRGFIYFWDHLQKSV